MKKLLRSHFPGHSNRGLRVRILACQTPEGIRALSTEVALHAIGRKRLELCAQELQASQVMLLGQVVALAKAVGVTDIVSMGMPDRTSLVALMSLERCGSQFASLAALRAFEAEEPGLWDHVRATCKLLSLRAPTYVFVGESRRAETSVFNNLETSDRTAAISQFSSEPVFNCIYCI